LLFRLVPMLRGALAVAALAASAEAFAAPSPAGALALRTAASSPHVSVSRQAPATLGGVVCNAESSEAAGAPSGRRDFGRLLAGAAAAGALGSPLAAFAAKDKLNCKAKANNGAAMGGTVCEGVEELKFQRAYETKGSATKLTGPKDKLSTFYPQINAGYITLVDLNDRWDQYNESGDGDVIRRRIGTVGSKSPLHNIRKVCEGAVKCVSRKPELNAEQFDELDELLNSLMGSIDEIDYYSYSTAFVGTQETADNLRNDAKTALGKALKRYRRFLDILAPLNEDQAQV